MADTYDDFKDKATSEKIGLAQIEAAERIVGWSVHSGSVFSRSSFDRSVIVSIEESGTGLTEVSSIAAVSAGKFFNDRNARIIYLETFGSINPNVAYMALVFRLFFSNNGVILPFDLASGKDVYWEPLIRGTSQFGVELDEQQRGIAISGKGSLTLVNDFGFFQSNFDKLTWDNQKVFIYSWNRDLAPSEAKLLYRGRITGKSYNTKAVKFTLKDFFNDLGKEIPLDDMEEFTTITPRLTNDLKTAKQRRVFGQMKSMIPTPIDSVDDGDDEGYPLTGTISVTGGSATVTGAGSLFLKELTPEDILAIVGFDDAITVKSIASDTSLTLSENAPDSLSGVAYRVIPSHPKKYINRKYLIAHHALREPITTVSQPRSARRFDVVDETDIEAGEVILVGSQLATVQSVSSTKLITIVQNLLVPPPIGTVVTRLTVSNVRINNTLLQFSRDFTYDAATALLTIDEDAEKNVAPIKSMTGTVTFNSGSRSVTGAGTVFKTQVGPGDWVRPIGTVDFFEILEVISDIALTLRTAPSVTNSGVAGEFKDPVILDLDIAQLSIDTLGRTENGVKTGVFIKTGAQVVKSLLGDAGLTPDLDTASFVTSTTLAPEKIGLAIPQKFDAENALKFREIIDQINNSIFGSLIQDEDFKLQYRVIDPGRDATAIKLTEVDVISFSVASKANRIIKTVRINYSFREFDPLSEDSFTPQKTATSETAEFLAKQDRERVFEVVLVDDRDAEVLASRWVFILEIGTSVVKFTSKLIMARSKVTDIVDFKHQKFYERIGSATNRKIGMVQSIKKGLTTVQTTMEDLGNALSRVATITEDSAQDFDNSSESELFLNGFITDENCMQANDPDTFNLNLIW